MKNKIAKNKVTKIKPIGQHWHKHIQNIRKQPYTAIIFVKSEADVLKVSFQHNNNFSVKKVNTLASIPSKNQFNKTDGNQPSDNVTAPTIIRAET